jgi:hypothetical protein
MRRCEFTICLLLAGAGRTVRAQEQAKHHRIAIVVSTGPAARINDKGIRLWQAFFEELRRLGDVEGRNLTIERYSGEGRPEGFADLAREVGQPEPGCDRCRCRSHHAGRRRGHQHDTDRRLRDLYQLGSLAEPGAPWRQSHRCQGRGVPAVQLPIMVIASIVGMAAPDRPADRPCCCGGCKTASSPLRIPLRDLPPFLNAR